MNKQNHILGLIVALGVSLIAALPRLIRVERFEFHHTAIGIAYNFTFCLCCWLVHRLILSRSRLRKLNSTLLAVFAIVSVSVFAFLLDVVFSALSHQAFLLPEVTDGRRPYVLLLRSVVISGLFYFIVYYLAMLAEKQRTALEIATLKQAQLSANLSSLKEQLSPHFMFNTLNTLSTLTHEQAVKDYVSELADVYRYVIQYKNEDTATLRQELNFIDSYLYILKIRLEDAIMVQVEVDQCYMDRKIPPLTLQLLVENAVKHNVASVTRQLRIYIKSDENGMLKVVNNLQPKTSVQYATGIGLGNVMQRYRLLFNREIGIERGVDSFAVKLPLV